MNSRHQPFVPGEPLAGRPGVRLVEEPIFARILGQGRPLVLVHGLAISGRMFASVAEDLATDHQLVIPDLRGQGRSGHLPGPYTARDLSEDLAALLQRLDISRATVLGYSQGGPIAQQLAHDHPQLVGRLVLACTYAYNMASLREKMEGCGNPGPSLRRRAPPLSDYGGSNLTSKLPVMLPVIGAFLPVSLT